MNDTYRIAVVSRAQTPNWHVDLADALRVRGHEVAFRFAAGPPAVPGLSTLRLLESIVAPSVSRAQGAGAVSAARPTPDDSAHDIRVDLVADALPAPVDATLIVPLYDGRPGELAALDALLDGRAPLISVATASPEDPAWRIVGEARPAIEPSRPFSYRLDVVLSHTGALLERVLGDPRALRDGSARPLGTEAPTAARAFGSPGFMVSRQVAQKIAGRLKGLAMRGAHWSVGVRVLDGTPSVRETHAWPAGGYVTVPDDGARYYADPFLFEHEGATYLFCEEYPYATAKGILSVAVLDPQGHASRPRPCLEAPYHLSYPQVFLRDGEIWMIPETRASGRIELWRAEHFPDVWVFDRTLVDDVQASDATLFVHERRLWLAATIDGASGSSWDTLCLWFADSLGGPWQAHAANPVLVDARCARPAGEVYASGGALWRPVQDCSDGYGSALGLCRIDDLSETSFRQTPVVRLGPSPSWRATGTHTLNVAGGFEAIDRLQQRRRW